MNIFERLRSNKQEKIAAVQRKIIAVRAAEDLDRRTNAKRSAGRGFSSGANFNPRNYSIEGEGKGRPSLIEETTEGSMRSPKEGSKERQKCSSSVQSTVLDAPLKMRMISLLKSKFGEDDLVKIPGFCEFESVTRQELIDFNRTGTSSTLPHSNLRRMKSFHAVDASTQTSLDLLDTFLRSSPRYSTSKMVSSLNGLNVTSDSSVPHSITQGGGGGGGGGGSISPFILGGCNNLSGGGNNHQRIWESSQPMNGRQAWLVGQSSSGSSFQSSSGSSFQHSMAGHPIMMTAPMQSTQGPRSSGVGARPSSYATSATGIGVQGLITNYLPSGDGESASSTMFVSESTRGMESSTRGLESSTRGLESSTRGLESSTRGIGGMSLETTLSPLGPLRGMRQQRAGGERQPPSSEQAANWSGNKSHNILSAPHPLPPSSHLPIQFSSSTLPPQLHTLSSSTHPQLHTLSSSTHPQLHTLSSSTHPQLHTLSSSTHPGHYNIMSSSSNNQLPVLLSNLRTTSSGLPEPLPPPIDFSPVHVGSNIFPSSTSLSSSHHSLHHQVEQRLEQQRMIQHQQIQRTRSRGSTTSTNQRSSEESLHATTGMSGATTGVSGAATGVSGATTGVSGSTGGITPGQGSVVEESASSGGDSSPSSSGAVYKNIIITLASSRIPSGHDLREDDEDDDRERMTLGSFEDEEDGDDDEEDDEDLSLGPGLEHHHHRAESPSSAVTTTESTTTTTSCHHRHHHPNHLQR